MYLIIPTRINIYFLLKIGDMNKFPNVKHSCIPMMMTS